MKTFFLLGLASLLTIDPVLAAEPAATPKTQICSPTEVVVSTPFNLDTPPTRKGKVNDWQAGIGEWTVKNGALYGDELPENHHPSSLTWKLEATDMVIQAQFRLGTAVHVAFGCRDTIAPNHHLGRTFISKDGVWIQRMSGISKTTKAEKLGEVKTPMDPEAWHDLTIEICGDHYRAQVDGHVVEAHHPRFKDAKGIVALIVKGQGAQFKNVSIWKARPKN